VGEDAEEGTLGTAASPPTTWFEASTGAVDVTTP
jgi:hypothetical protein